MLKYVEKFYKEKAVGGTMNKNLVIIYAYIMLECRLSIEKASRIFRLDKDTFQNHLNFNILPIEVIKALRYLEFETKSYGLDNKRGIFKANLYIRKLRRILAKYKGEERKKKLEDLVNDLKGPDIRFVLEKNIIGVMYTKEEKEQILKYRLKYAVSCKNMETIFHIDKGSIVKWEKELPEDELKFRLEILRKYLNYKYTGPRSRK